ncbi:MAG: adenosylcobinamide-GDP ribazoletransferase [Geminicoccaceae bacterium]
MLRDWKVATMFLTRLPVRLEGKVGLRDLAQTVYLFPVIGVLVGLAGGIAFALATFLGLPSLPASLIAIGTTAMLTGALHEDGLADTFDGLGAGTDRQKALEIMGDSRIGSFGTLALIFTVTARVTCLSAFWEPILAATVLIAAGALSRAAIAVVMWWQPSAKATGLAAAAGRPEPIRVAMAVLLALAIAVSVMPAPQTLVTAAVTALVTAAFAAWIGQRLGGCTGDTLGAVQQTAEVTFLMAAMVKVL